MEHRIFVHHSVNAADSIDCVIRDISAHLAAVHNSQAPFLLQTFFLLRFSPDALNYFLFNFNFIYDFNSLLSLGHNSVRTNLCAIHAMNIMHIYVAVTKHYFQFKFSQTFIGLFSSELCWPTIILQMKNGQAI